MAGMVLAGFFPAFEKWGLTNIGGCVIISPEFMKKGVSYMLNMIYGYIKMNVNSRRLAPGRTA